MKNAFLPVVAVTLAFIGIFYSACDKSKVEALPADANLLQNDIQRMEFSYSSFQKIHSHLVDEHSTLMGELPDSLHLLIEQKHLALIESDKQLIADISMMHQFSAPGDSLELKTKLQLINDAITRIESDLKQVEADHETMMEAHKR